MKGVKKIAVIIAGAGFFVLSKATVAQSQFKAGSYSAYFPNNGSPMVNPTSIAVSPCTGNVYYTDPANGHDTAEVMVLPLKDPKSGVTSQDVASIGNSSTYDANGNPLPDGTPVGGGLILGRIIPSGESSPYWRFGNKKDQQGKPVNSNSPPGVAVDSSGNVYAVNRSDNTVVLFKEFPNNESGTSPNESTAARTYTTDTFFTGSDNGKGGFDNASRVAVDSSGTVYVADTGHNSVELFKNGKFVTSLDASSNGKGGFNNPYSIAVDSLGTVYVADTGHNSVELFKNGKFNSSLDGSSNGQGGFNQPYGVAAAVDSLGTVYVVVADTGHNSVELFKNGKFVTSLDPVSSSDPQSKPFNKPKGVAIDSLGLVYVADTGDDNTGNGRIVTFGITDFKPGQQQLNSGCPK